MPGTEGALSVFWSPDGRSLAFFADGKLKRIDLPGGAAVPLCDVPAISAFGTWGSDGTILFATFVGDAIFSVSSAGGTPEAIVTPDPSRGERVVWPSFLPDGKRFLYLSQLPNITGQLMLGAARTRPAADRVRGVERPMGRSRLPGVCAGRRARRPAIRSGERADRRCADLDCRAGRPFPLERAGDVHDLPQWTRSRITRTRTSRDWSGWIAPGKEIGTVGAPGNYLNVRLSPDGGTVLFESDEARNRHVGPLDHSISPEASRPV